MWPPNSYHKRVQSDKILRTGDYEAQQPLSFAY